MPNVKTVWVLLKERGAEEVKAQLEEVAAEARKVADMDPTVKLSVDDKAALASLEAMRVELRALKDAGNAAGLQDLAQRFKDVSASSDNARVKLSALKSEAEALRSAVSRDGGDGGGGGGGGLLGVFGKLRNALTGGAGLGGALATVTQALRTSITAGWIPIAIAGGAVLVTALFPMIAALTTIAASIGALAAFAVPEFTKIWAAVTGGDKAMDRLNKGERAVAEQGKGLVKTFDQIAKAVQPSILQMFAAGLKVIRDLMPALKDPLVEGAAHAFTTLFNNINHWLMSGAGQRFLHWFETEGPKAMMTFARVIWDTANALGRAFHFMEDQGNTWDNQFKTNVNDAQHGWTSMGQASKEGAAVQSSAWSLIMAAGFRGSAALRQAWNIIVAAGMAGSRAVLGELVNLAGWFQALPGRIVSFLSGLPGMLYRAGQAAIQGLISGLGSMLGALGSMASSIASKIAGFFGLSPAREGPLSGGGAPYIRGQHFATDFAAGMASQANAARMSAELLANAAASGRGRLAGAAAGQPVIFELRGGGSGLDRLFMTWLANSIRAQGGDPRVLVRKVQFT